LSGVSATDADVDLIRQAIEGWEARGDDVDAYYERFWHPDAVVESVDGFPTPGRYEGLDGYRQWFDDAYGPYENVGRRLHSLTAVGDWVVVLLTLTGRPRDEPVDLEVRVGTTYEIEGGRIRRMRVFLGHERALEAARAASGP
jgi:ketosteroid isomerase-like protein